MRLHLNNFRVLGQYPAAITYGVFWVVLLMVLLLR